MRKIAILAVCVGSLGLLGCGGGGGDDADAAIIDFTDADTTQIDSGTAACNPVAQTGCLVNEKCTWIVDSAGPPLLAYTGCAPDGDKGAGAACTSPEVGYDDCVAGYYCLNSECNEICDSATNSCPAGFICSTYSELLDDVENVGLCNPGCDPVQQNCVNTAQACYLQATTGEASCAGVPVGAETQLQGMPCYGPATGGCYLNGCAKGYGTNLPDDTCAFFCNPIDNWSGNVQGLSGDPAGIPCESTFGGARPDGPGPAFECRFMQSYYSNTDLCAVTTGLCVDPAEDYGQERGGSCGDFNYDQLVSDVGDGTAEAQGDAYCATYCPDCCMSDCVSLATWDAIFAFRSAKPKWECFSSRREIREQYCSMD